MNNDATMNKKPTRPADLIFMVPPDTQDRYGVWNSVRVTEQHAGHRRDALLSSRSPKRRRPLATRRMSGQSFDLWHSPLPGGVSQAHPPKPDFSENGLIVT